MRVCKGKKQWGCLLYRQTLLFYVPRMEQITMKITLLNTESTYKQLQPFKTLDQLNANTRAIRERYSNQLTKSTYRVLDVLAKYSCKFFGVSYRSKNKIASELGISVKTVTRSCAKLEELGIIKQYATKRATGDKRRSTDAVVFVPLNLVQNDNVSTQCPDKDTPINTKDLSNTKDTVAASQNADDKEYLKNSLPDGWYEQAVAYARNAQDLYTITGELFKAKHGTTIKIEDYVEEFGQVLQQSWFNLKQGRVNPNRWYAYLYAAFKRTAHNLEGYQKAKPIMDGIKELFDPDYQSKIKTEYANKYPLQKNNQSDAFLIMH